MSFRGCKPEEGAEEVGADVENIKAGGSRPSDIGEIIQGGGVDNPTVRRRDIGNPPLGLGRPRDMFRIIL